MTNPSPEEKRAREAFQCLYLEAEESTVNGTLALTEAWVRAAEELAVLAERERCERTANEAVFEALADTAPDHIDDEGRLDGYSFAAMATIATKVVLAIRKDPS